MKVGTPKERAPDERRVALVPDTVTRLAGAALEVSVESGAGAAAYISDDAYKQAGATIVQSALALLGEADAVLKVEAPSVAEVGHIKSGAVLISFLQPATQGDIVRALAKRGVTAFSLELVPRISRAQSMDALSSQASVAGYKAVLMAAGRVGKFFPMMMTAAGTIPPARVLVMGAGVAGLQAIATARRLGAVVSAYDVRPAVKEEVQSLGATFIELALETQEGEGGYAREQSDEFLRKQRELIGEHVAKSDVVITTAAVPGRRAPLLVTGEMVKGMRPGSVIVDLAAETGGNVELTQVGKDVEVGGVTIIGTRNVPSTMPLHASQLYARNVANLLLHLVKDGAIALDFEDEITKGCCVTHGGEIVNERAKQLVASAPL
ncbi:MAG: NAD(P) transhydrogenase subunit alpha [Actinobacteria bacterium 13_1_20CM_2_65_11]|nr:MAG: NAD(P) transhydrogenase subunit alpha [Chloroflexi bacterium 13_1_40CM_65_17]OLC66849.1 MAG: NAD(P) transhydrogenase subunit alpha [Actinobacteria bacterium 13_1_40CM_4_65_12]OLD26336.1 MAG: NAD(P) transhydrogenase subunit alpha [Chloroflexi bacterium 13_1_40CM_3_65_12]OLD48728.1 MAG: NAD(P) transhydrogenase subunit alpha [Actinobacteria bacterium 13_1_40CM_2_65_8]OLE79859.1 MAG: NAD(P) transhydrogenase subunit alpha [Actinobacteria bacterium 13_1_20CM_2_65_11]